MVHGHTISDEVEQRPNRIGIDTGAYRSGTLTALAIEGTDRWLVDTRGQTASEGYRYYLNYVAKRNEEKPSMKPGSRLFMRMPDLACSSA